ncbi:MAG: ATPase domain-containing protein [Salinarchaeum sp.]
MARRDDVVATGSAVLDQMLGGGLPARRATLVTGGPGTGKSTLGMQFLQTGLENDETGLYISTEQTIEEIRQSFAGFAFNLDADNLTMTSLHATPGQTIEEEDTLTLETFEDDDPLGTFDVPFTIEYVQDHLREFAPVDRVVFDSASGLRAIAEDEPRYRRNVLELIRFFTDELEATTLFTAEEHADESGDDVLQFTTHGVIRLSYTQIESDRHRSLEIKKMRGHDHDHRRVEVQFTNEGLRLGPRRRSQPPALKTHAHQPIGIEGLDSLTGGGLVAGSGVLLQHDGRTNLNALLGRLLSFGVETDRTIVLVPTIELRETQIERIMRDAPRDLEELLEIGQLVVVDLIGTWDATRPNVYTAPDDVEAYTALLEEVLADHDDNAWFGLVNANALVHTFGPEGARRVRYATEASLLGESDLLVHVLNPNVVDEQSSAFFEDTAEQILRASTNAEGLQYLTLRKSPCGFVGSTSLVEYMTEPPYLRVQEPPQTRTSYTLDERE